MTGRFATKAIEALVQVAKGLGGSGFAQKVLQALVVCTPHWRHGPWLVARLCTKERWFAVATRIGEIGLQRNSSDVALRLVVADSYLAGRQFDAALHHAQALIAAAPNNFDGFHIGSESLQQLGQSEEASPCWNRASSVASPKGNWLTRGAPDTCSVICSLSET